uniref:CCHC-type domain-containing protein n=1 Tax=Setaria viridis TaxID=4556 RepID=A0A4U6VS05_SETVI|nr:hypothetical protein SEVIR_2G103800v2 [Setaria viridis]
MRRQARPEKPRRDGGHDRSRRDNSRRPSSRALLAFKRETEGRCFRCLAPNHLASACRDPVRCRRFGHRERECRAARPQPQWRSELRGPPRTPTPPAKPSDTAPDHRLPPNNTRPSTHRHSSNRRPPIAEHHPLQPRATTPKMAIGDPNTRPEVETVFVSTTFHLEHDARDWEACALVPWALHLPPDAGARDIADLLTRELHLQPGDVAVTLHQPKPYLIRFEQAEHAAEARRRGRFTGAGIDICLRTWRSLTHALGFRIFYRVRLCLDGIPSHAWTPEIVERVIGHKCALQHIVTDLLQPADSRHIELWAWTVDPSEIPKKRCDDRPFMWPSRRGGDDDDQEGNYDHPGQGRHIDSDYWGGRTFDMTKVRRSARLAKKPAMPAVERAQRNLWKKLGVGNDEMMPIEQVLQDFLNMFQGALPDYIISAMTALFDLDDEAADQANEALLQMAGADVGELQQMDHAAA